MPGKIYAGTLTGAVGGEIGFALIEQAAAGYRWEVEFDPAFLKQTFNETSAMPVHGADKDHIGGPVWREMRFKPLVGGETELTLICARPWQKNAPAERRVYKIKIG